MDDPSDNRPPITPPDTSKVSPDAREVIPAFGLGRFAPFDWIREVHRTAIRPRWGWIAAWLCTLVCVAWLAVATGLYAFVKYRRGFTEVRFSHMALLPWKLNEYRRSKGEFLIREGLAKAEAQAWRPAFDLLRAGLGSVPEHREARMLVARIYLMAGRPDMTRTILLEGLPYHGDQLEYLREVLGYFFGLQADDTVIAIAQELSSRIDPQTPAARMLSTALAYAYFNRSRYAEAETVLKERRLLATPEGRFVTARIDWARGSHETALARLRELASQVPQDNEIYRTLVHHLREKRRFADIRRVSLERQLALPDRPESYLDFISACAEEGDEQRRADAEAAYLQRFADNTLALLKLSELASNTGRPEIARQVFLRCRELGRDEIEALFQLISAFLATRQYDEALALWADVASRSAGWNERHQIILGALRGMAYFGKKQDIEAQPLVRRLSETRLVPAHILTAMAARLDEIGQPAEARRVLQHATEIDPLYQPALVLRLRKALDDKLLDEAAPLIERLLTMRKPPLDLVQHLARVLESDLHLFQPRRKDLLKQLNTHARQSEEALRAAS